MTITPFIFILITPTPPPPTFTPAPTFTPVPTSTQPVAQVAGVQNLPRTGNGGPPSGPRWLTPLGIAFSLFGLVMVGARGLVPARRR
jgi:hypothetical protein